MWTKFDTDRWVEIDSSRAPSSCPLCISPCPTKQGEVDDGIGGPFILREFIVMFLVIFAWVGNVP